MKQLLQLFTSIYPLSEELIEHLSKILKSREVLKKQTLLKASHICRHIYFIEKGLFRCYYERQGAEISSWFMKEGDIMIAVESFFRQVPSYEAIQALEDSLLYYIEYQELQHIYHRYPEFNFIARVLTQEYYMLSEQRLYSLHMQTAPERLRFLEKHFPQLLQRVPAKYLASYLGISEAHFSVIRAKK